MPMRRSPRVPVVRPDPWPARPPASIGHNQGPPLHPASGWGGFCWRKAHRSAWRTPPIEVVRRRCKRARDLGLSYRDYTAIALDRGTSARALLFDLGGTLVRVDNNKIRTDREGRIWPLPGVIEKLSRLRDCLVFVLSYPAEVAEGLLSAAKARSFVEQVDDLCGGVIDDFRVSTDPDGSGGTIRKARTGMVLDLLAKHGVPPSAAVMVGDSDNDRACAEAAWLARFIWSWDYFGRSAP